ncbi:MAG: SGNH/GDSL hydrolase family protein, partial [bacterium]
MIPTDIANCVLWLKADTGITQGTATGRVSAWADQSGAGNHFAQGTANKQPHIYDDPIFGKRICFNPTQTEPHFLTSALPVDTQSFSIFIVSRTTNAVNSNVVPLFNNTTGAGNGALLYFNYRPCVYNGGSIRYSSRRMNSMLDIQGYCAGASDCDLYANTTKTTVSALSSEVGTYASLGRWHSDSDVFLGDMVEVFAYSRKLTSGEQEDVIEYLRDKHGIVEHTVNTVLLGDSISQGVGATEARTLPMFLEIHIPKNVSLLNLGVSGRTWNGIAAAEPQPISSMPRNIVLGFAGTNDIAGGDSAATAYADKITALSPYVGAGWESVTVAMIPRDGITTARTD